MNKAAIEYYFDPVHFTSLHLYHKLNQNLSSCSWHHPDVMVNPTQHPLWCCTFLFWFSFLPIVLIIQQNVHVNLNMNRWSCNLQLPLRFHFCSEQLQWAGLDASWREHHDPDVLSVINYIIKALSQMQALHHEGIVSHTNLVSSICWLCFPQCAPMQQLLVFMVWASRGEPLHLQNWSFSVSMAIRCRPRLLLKLQRCGDASLQFGSGMICVSASPSQFSGSSQDRGAGCSVHASHSTSAGQHRCVQHTCTVRRVKSLQNVHPWVVWTQFLL